MYIKSAENSTKENINLKNMQRKQRRVKKAWYSNDCKILKRKLNQIRKILDRNPEKKETRMLFYKTQKEYENSQNSKEENMKRVYQRN